MCLLDEINLKMGVVGYTCVPFIDGTWKKNIIGYHSIAEIKVCA